MIKIKFTCPCFGNVEIVPDSIKIPIDATINHGVYDNILIQCGTCMTLSGRLFEDSNPTNEAMGIYQRLED